MAQTLHLHAGGVSVLMVARDGEPPAVVHWGASLGDLSEQQCASAVAAVEVRHRSRPGHPAFPAPAATLTAHGAVGTPGLSGHRDGMDWSPCWNAVAGDHGHGSVAVTGDDESAQLRWGEIWRLDSNGVLRVQWSVTNLADATYDVESVVVRLPVPLYACELLDLTGRWAHEREPQRHSFVHGTFRREGRHGRTGHDATLLLTAGTEGFGFQHGEVWSVHTAWSGNHVTLAERNADGDSVLGGGELLSPGEVRLARGQTYTTPWIYAVWSGEGLDGVSRRLHRHLRARPRHPSTPRPVILNTWEAVYFDHDVDSLKALADKAADVGIERFVLDDGWFRGRRSDRAGLGDWFVDTDVWPDGLSPLVDHVLRLGMQFGLWVEPEMINLDSDLARAHPDWVLSYDGRLPPQWRHQQVLDLTNPEAFAHIASRIDRLVQQYSISYLKWDHNRDLIDVRVHAQTQAAYALLDELRTRHPNVEIESCSSGGARIDLEILQRTDRVWASDTNDALERQQIQRWTGLLLPPELVGSHVGPPRSHTTGRRHELSLRAITALFGHVGIEWDIATASDSERAELAGWVAIAKSQRDLIHTGDIVRIDEAEPGLLVHGVVAADRTRALFAVVAIGSRSVEPPPLVRFAGLDPTSSYRLVLLSPDVGGSAPSDHVAAIHRTNATSGVTQTVLPGSAFMRLGWRAPAMTPESALLIRLDSEVTDH